MTILSPFSALRFELEYYFNFYMSFKHYAQAPSGFRTIFPYFSFYASILFLSNMKYWNLLHLRITVNIFSIDNLYSICLIIYRNVVINVLQHTHYPKTQATNLSTTDISVPCISFHSHNNLGPIDWGHFTINVWKLIISWRVLSSEM